jgi:hypothetical protein
MIVVVEEATGGWLMSAGPGSAAPLTPHDEQPLGAAKVLTTLVPQVEHPLTGMAHVLQPPKHDEYPLGGAQAQVEQPPQLEHGLQLEQTGAAQLAQLGASEP